MDGIEEGQQRNCGRHIFREADLAYLLIGGERMFPLAELLASLFSNTARTTLFTRMEKINTRRHFCSAEEIKLLKTVNGIHGSSAICTLIPEADVQKYCAVYIDRTVDIKLFSTSIRRTKAEKDISKTKDSKQGKGGTENSVSTAKTNEGKSSTSSNVVRDEASKSLKGKKAYRGTQKFNNGTKAKVPRVVKTTHKSNRSDLLDECCESEVVEQQNSISTLAEHVLNGNQTRPHSYCGIKARKKRKAKDSLDDNFVKSNLRQNKKATRADELEESDSFRGSSWSQYTTQGADVNGNRSVIGRGGSSTEHPCGSSLSQCLTNANSEILFSDASSNDSGFASTTISESSKRNKPSTSLDSNHEKPCQSKAAISISSSKHGKYRRFKKTKLEPKEDKPVNQSLSPPALVLKRQNNVWQVETKSEQKIDTEPSSNRSTTQSKAKKRLKWSSCNDEKFKHQQETTKKTIIMKKSKKKVFPDKDEVSLAIQLDARGSNLKRNQKANRKNMYQHCDNNSKMNAIDQNVRNGDILVKSSQVSNIVKRGRKSKQLSNNLQNTKKVVVAKTLKANKDFKFMSLFSSFPLLSVKEGDLCPRFSEVLPAHSKSPSASHPIWKWQQGRPIYVPEGRKTCVR